MLGLISSTVYTFRALPLGLVALIIYKRLTKPERKPIQKTDWKKDVVYLYQFPLVPKVRTVSPFALKVETWLRLNKIAYEAIHTMVMSKHGQIPYIELNGEEISDSNIIIKKLQQHFNVDAVYNKKEQGIAHAAISMMENHLVMTGFDYRYGLHIDKFVDYLHLSSQFSWVRYWQRIQPWSTRLRSYLQGLGRHEYGELWEFAREDLLALSEMLGDSPFLLGDTPSTVDCALFGHLIQFLYIDIGFPQRKVLVKECPNLVNLVERMKTEYWPDWEAQTPQRK